jgi:hypothetical protein
MSNHRTHYQIERRMDRRAEATLNYVLAIAIGIGLACLLIAWWSS